MKEAREEHRAAIEWLNNNTVNDINFFLIEIHAYRIGDSDPAPKFEVVEKPNAFVKRSKAKDHDDGELNKSEAARLYFWEEFNKVLVARGKPFNIRKATTDHWYDVAIGSSDAHKHLCSRQSQSLLSVPALICRVLAFPFGTPVHHDLLCSSLDCDYIIHQVKCIVNRHYAQSLVHNLVQIIHLT